MRVLNIEVSDALLASWQDWLAPETQPFFLTKEESVDLPPQTSRPDQPVLRGIPPTVSELHPLRDTFQVPNVAHNLIPIWLSEEEFTKLPAKLRSRLVRAQVDHGRGAVPTVKHWTDLLDEHLLRQQSDGYRFVWWPSLVKIRPTDILQRVISDEFPPSRHEDVSAKTWTRCADVLPNARRLSGTFAPHSGPNCFGTVMTAAGVPNVEELWMFQAPFEQWLAQTATAGGDDQDPGTILVWRNNDGLAIHAAVTIGDGWVLEKPSQGWLSPRSILPIREVIKAGRKNGVHLKRYAIRSA